MVDVESTVACREIMKDAKARSAQLGELLPDRELRLMAEPETVQTPQALPQLPAQPGLREQSQQRKGYRRGRARRSCTADPDCEVQAQHRRHRQHAGGEER